VYTESECFGRGGFGSVFKAIEKKTGRVITIKRLSDALTEDACNWFRPHVGMCADLISGCALTQQRDYRIKRKESEKQKVPREEKWKGE
jgi:serine/threonine protein kinase